MIRYFLNDSGRLKPVDGMPELRDDLVWIDLIEPTQGVEAVDGQVEIGGHFHGIGLLVEQDRTDGVVGHLVVAVAVGLVGLVPALLWRRRFCCPQIGTAYQADQPYSHQASLFPLHGFSPLCFALYPLLRRSCTPFRLRATRDRGDC